MIKRPILRVECTVNELKNFLPKFFNLQKVRYSDTHLNNSQKPSINQFILHEINNIFVSRIQRGSQYQTFQLQNQSNSRHLTNHYSDALFQVE